MADSSEEHLGSDEVRREAAIRGFRAFATRFDAMAEDYLQKPSARASARAPDRPALAVMGQLDDDLGNLLVDCYRQGWLRVIRGLDKLIAWLECKEPDDSPLRAICRTPGNVFQLLIGDIVPNNPDCGLLARMYPAQFPPMHHLKPDFFSNPTPETLEVVRLQIPWGNRRKAEACRILADIIEQGGAAAGSKAPTLPMRGNAPPPILQDALQEARNMAETRKSMSQAEEEFSRLFPPLEEVKPGFKLAWITNAAEFLAHAYQAFVNNKRRAAGQVERLRENFRREEHAKTDTPPVPTKAIRAFRACAKKEARSAKKKLALLRKEKHPLKRKQNESAISYLQDAVQGGEQRAAMSDEEIKAVIRSHKHEETVRARIFLTPEYDFAIAAGQAAENCRLLNIRLLSAVRCWLAPVYPDLQEIQKHEIENWPAAIREWRTISAAASAGGKAAPPPTGQPAAENDAAHRTAAVQADPEKEGRGNVSADESEPGKTEGQQAPESFPEGWYRQLCKHGGCVTCLDGSVVEYEGRDNGDSPVNLAYVYKFIRRHGAEIRYQCNRLARHPEDRELRVSYMNWRGLLKMDSDFMRGIPGAPALPEFPTLVGNDFHAAMLRLDEYCEEVLRRLTSNTAASPAGATPLPKEGRNMANRSVSEAQGGDDKPDDNGFVKKPANPKDYILVSKLIDKLKVTSADINAFKRTVLDPNPSILRWQKTPRRLAVHLVTFLAHLESMALAEASTLGKLCKKGIWICRRCNNAYVDVAGQANCPKCQSDKVIPLIVRPKK